MNEADTCRIYVEPKLRAAGWETPPHSVASQPVLDDLVDKYVEHGLAQFDLRDLLQVRPIATRGNLVEIVGYFQGAERMHQAVDQMQALLYAA